MIADDYLVQLAELWFTKTSELVFSTLAAEADNEYAQMDGTVVWIHQHSASAKKQSHRRCTREALGSMGGVPKRKLGVQQRQVSLATPD